jgi:hypothetical protein
VIGGRASERIGAAGGDQHQAGDLDQSRLDIDTKAFGYVIVFGAAPVDRAPVRNAWPWRSSR